MAGKEEMNFGIEETLDTGTGDPNLIKSLLADESSETTDSDDLESIEEKIEEDDIKQKPDKAKKEVVTSEEEEDDISGEELIDKFLTSNEDEEEEGEEQEEGKKTDPIKKEEGEEEGEEVSKGENEVDFTALTNELFDLGVFQKGEDDEDLVIGSGKDLLDRFNLEKKKGAAQWLDNLLGQYGEDYQNAFEAIFVKGVNPKDYFDTYNEITDVANIDLTKDYNQKKVIKESLLAQEWEEEDIDEEVKRLEEIGDLEKVSARHQKVLVKRDVQKLKHKEKQAEQLIEQKQAIKNQYIKNVQSILQEKLKTKDFDGIPLNSQFANELNDFLLVDKWRNPMNGETLTDFDRTILELKKPENHEMKVKLAALYKMLEKDPTLSTIRRSAVSKESNKIFEQVARQKTKKQSATKGQGKSYFNYL